MWAKKAYENLINSSQSFDIQLKETDLTSNVASHIPENIGSILTSVDWNTYTSDHLSDLGAVYYSTEQAGSYFRSTDNLLKSRLVELEKRLLKLSSTLQTITTTQKLTANTSIDIRGGDQSWVETNSKFYVDSPMLSRVTGENVFRLPSTGTFSSIRSMGGFSGRVVIEKTIGHVHQVGSIDSIADGDSNTFWMGTTYSPAPIRVDSNDISWVPAEYKHGFPLLLTYYLDRPTNISELYIDPVSTGSFDLVSVRWSPMGMLNVLPTSNFASSGMSGWTFSGNSQWSLGAGFASSGGVWAGASSGWISHTFNLSDVITKSVSGVATAVASGDFKGQRVQVKYSMMGIGNCRAGCRIVWYNASGSIIDYKLEEDFPTGFFKGYVFTDMVPTYAVSGRLDLGIFSLCSNASAFFDGVEMLVGEQNWNCNLKITNPVSVSLPSNIISNRVSFVFCQRNPSIERLTKTVVESPFISGDKNIDPSLQKITQQISEDLSSPGKESSVFAYRVGLKELDLRYREYVPRGSLVSIPLRTTNEIRRLWSTSNIGKHQTGGINFFIHPFPDNENYKVPIIPFTLSGEDSVEGVSRVEGDILYIYTSEEINEPGWEIPSSRSTLIVDPRKYVQTFDGTNREGKIILDQSPHTRKVIIDRITKWLDLYSLWPTTFDPNADTLYGVNDQSIIDSIRVASPGAISMASSSLIAIAGYRPIKVTIKTDKWTAIPDSNGRPDKSRIRNVSGELLEQASVVQTSTSTSTDVTGYDQVTLNSTIPKTNVYNTQYSPLVMGSNYLRLWWYDPSGVDYVSIPPSDYSVDNLNGQITLNTKAPEERFTGVVADYKYVADQSIEDFFGSILSYVTESGSGLTDPTGYRKIAGRYLPITRNMTDYATGKVPTLRKFNSDRLSSDYFPVIEYYISSSGEMIFSGPFFKYGDTPATIQVEIETLGISPRIGIEIRRSNFPSASTSMYGLSLKTKEGNNVPIREIS